MAHKKSIIGFGIVLLIALAAVLPFFGQGFLPTHDGEYHIIRFIEFDRMIKSGYLFPRWAPTLNSGYGLPLFQFMYPFVNYVASGLHFLGLEYVATFKISSALAYLTAIVFCFLWLKKRFGLYSAVIGSAASAFVPYWFVELYVRGVIGELWALAAFFAILYSVEQDWPWFTSAAVAILILSHNILAMLFFPLVVLYVLWRKNWKWLPWVMLGIGLSCWFWLPALSEAKYMQGLNTVNFRDHFATIEELLIPSWGTEFSGALGGSKISFQIGIGPLLWILSALGLIVFRPKSKNRKEIFFVLTSVSFIIFLTLSYAMPIWNAIPVLQLVQYPWRLLVYLIPVVAYLSAVVSHTVKRRWVVGVLAVLSVVFSFSYTRGAVYAPRNDTHYLSRQNFTDGTSSMGNSLSTMWTSWKQVRPTGVITDSRGEPLSFVTIDKKYLDRHYEVSLDTPKKIRLNILYFPGWRVTVDGKAVAIDFSSNGTLDFEVPSGKHKIVATLTETPVRFISDIISIASLAVLAFWGILHLYAYRH